MNWTEFVSRFPEANEIGRDLHDERLQVFIDSGAEVGVWEEDTRSTVGTGRILSHADAELARGYYGSKQQERAR